MISLGLGMAVSHSQYLIFGLSFLLPLFSSVFPSLPLSFAFIRKQEFCDFMQEMLSMMNKVKDEVLVFFDAIIVVLLEG